MLILVDCFVNREYTCGYIALYIYFVYFKRLDWNVCHHNSYWHSDLCTPHKATLKSKFQPHNSYINHNCSHVDLSVHFVNVVLHNRGLSIWILLPNTITFQLFKFESLCESILYLMYFIITQKYQYIAKVLIDNYIAILV